MAAVIIITAITTVAMMVTITVATITETIITSVD